jgi:hypothetical protein
MFTDVSLELAASIVSVVFNDKVSYLNLREQNVKER